MAQKSIREYFGKNLLNYYLNGPKSYKGILVSANNLLKVKDPGFKQGYVVKPDELFGKRGKNKLIFISKSFKEIKDWIKEKSSKSILVKRSSNDKGISGMLNNFLIEPLVEHKQEYYLAMSTSRNDDIVYFSNKGGIDIEENWDNVSEFHIPFSLKNGIIPETYLKKIAKEISSAKEIELIIKFIKKIYKLFKELDFSYLEINPFTIENGNVMMLDLVARLDDTALYKNFTKWKVAGDVEFPEPFGSQKSNSELEIMELDRKSGASLKFRLLNPNGKIWMLTSGGGGSVIFADTVGDLGFANELANYGEYSGNPTGEETEAYTEIVIKEMLSHPTKNKVLIIGGGIANFTDIRTTFNGINKVIRRHAAQIKKQDIKIYVRRGGPHYKEGLTALAKELHDLQIKAEVYGPEMYMTEVINRALKK